VNALGIRLFSNKIRFKYVDFLFSSENIEMKIIGGKSNSWILFEETW
jgi:hypothetical protein